MLARMKAVMWALPSTSIIGVMSTRTSDLAIGCTASPMAASAVMPPIEAPTRMGSGGVWASTVSRSETSASIE